MTYSKDRTLLTSLGFADPDKKDSRHDLGCQYVVQNRSTLLNHFFKKNHDTKAIKFECNVQHYFNSCIESFLVLESNDFTFEKEEILNQVQKHPYFLENTKEWIQQQPREALTKFNIFPADEEESIFHRLYPPRIKYDYYSVQRSNPVGKPLTVVGTIQRTFQEPVQLKEKYSFEYVLSKGENQFKTTIGFLDVVICQNILIHEIIEGRFENPVFPTISKKTEHSYKEGLIVEVKINQLPIGDLIRQMNLYRTYALSRTNGGGVNTPFNEGRNIIDYKWVVATAFPLSEYELKVLETENYHHIFLGEKFTDFCQKRLASSPVAAQIEI